MLNNPPQPAVILDLLLCLIPLAETRASIRVIGTNRVTVDTGRVSFSQANEISYFNQITVFFLSLSDSPTNTRLNRERAEKQNAEMENMLCHLNLIFFSCGELSFFLANACVCPLQGHRVHVLDFDAVWNEGASPKDIYESTTKAFTHVALDLLLSTDSSIHQLFTKSVKFTYI